MLSPKRKLYQYVEDDMLIDKQLGNFYHFLRRETEERELKETRVDSLRYSALEDEAYEEILVEVLEDLRWIIADYRYSTYLPLRSQIDQLQPIIHSLGQALEDARELHRRREITDSRQILTERAFESPNDQQYQMSSSSEIGAIMINCSTYSKSSKISKSRCIDPFRMFHCL